MVMRASVASLAFMSWASLLALPGSLPAAEQHFQPTAPVSHSVSLPAGAKASQVLGPPQSSVKDSVALPGSNTLASSLFSNASPSGLPGLAHFPLVPYSALALASGTQDVGGPAASSAPTGGSPAGSGVSVGSSLVASDIRSLLRLTNQDRTQHGLPPLTVNRQLASLAQERATAMATYGYYGHDSPIYGWPFQMEQTAGIQAVWMGAENIDEAASPAQANSAFMLSPPHRANILDPRETQIGIGVAELPNMPGYIVISELFLGPSL